MPSAVVLQRFSKAAGVRRLQPLLTVFLFAAAFLIYFAPGAKADGELDPTFGNGGVVLEPQSSKAAAVAVTPDGKYIAAGCTGGFCRNTILIRYLANGELDPSFDGDGMAIFDFGPDMEALTALTIEESGGDYKIVAAGEASERFALARFNANGSLDTTFGDGQGIVLGPTGTAASIALQPKPDPQGSDKWVLAGKSNPFGSQQGDDLVVARFDRTTGALDTTFNNPSGFVKIAMEELLNRATLQTTNEGAEDVVIDSNRKIYAVGYTTTPDGVPDDRRMLVICLAPDGQLDASFNGDGIFTAPQGIESSLSSAIFQGNKLVAAGRVEDNLALVRLDQGDLDATFGTGGIARGPRGRAAALVEHDTTLMAAGRTNPAEEYSTYYRNAPSDRDVLVTRFLSDGRVDADFGTEGSVITKTGDKAVEATSLTVDSRESSNPKIVTAGLSGEHSIFRIFIARYLATGQPGNVNLQLTMQGPPGSVRVGAKQEYRFTILNRGPADAVSVRMEHLVPPQVEVIESSLEPSQGVCSSSPGTVDCRFGAIRPGRTATVTVAGVPNAPGTVTSSASITTSSPENDLSDNAATVTTAVMTAEGAFTPAAQMNEARSGHQAVRLAGPQCVGVSPPSWCGRVLVIGPITAELYDPAADRWTPAGTLNVEHGKDKEYTATLLSDGRVLVVGTPLLITGPHPRAGEPGPVSLAEIYDPTQGTWTVIPGPNTPRNGHVAVGLSDGRVLVAGGQGNETVTCSDHQGRQVEESDANLRSAEILDVHAPGGPRWTPAQEMNEWRAAYREGGATANLLPNGDVLVVGGDKGNPWHANPSIGPAPCSGTPLAGAEVRNGRTGEWTKVPGFQPERHGHSATPLNNEQVLVAGGNTTVGDTITTPSASLYQPNRTWGTPDGLMVFGRSEHAAALLPNGKVLITGGINYERKDLEYPPKTAELYNPFTRSFEPAGLTTWRALHTVITLGPGPFSACGRNCGKVLIAGGIDVPRRLGNSVTKSAELYTSPPSVARVEPSEGPVTGNTEIVISGLALASASKVTFEGAPPLVCGPKGQAKCWVDEELPDRKLHVITPAHAVPEQVDLVVETLPGLLAGAHFRYTGVELPSGPAPPVPRGTGTLPGQQTTQLPAPPSGTATSVQLSNPSAAQGAVGAPGAVPPGAVAPGAVVAQSPQSIPESAQSVQAATGNQSALQPQFGLYPGLAPAPDEEPQPAPRFMFSRLEEPHLVLGWAASVVLGALALCVFGMDATRSAPHRPAAGRARAGPEGCRRIAI